MIFIIVYFYLIAAFLFCFLIGHILVSSIQKKATNDQLFEKLIIGYLFLGSSFAIINSKGITVTLLIFFTAILFLCIYYRKFKFSITPKLTFININYFQLIFALIPLTCFFFFNLNYLIEFSSNQFKLLDGDYSFYARIAGFLRDTGIENNNVDYFSELDYGLSPYRYLDLWFTAAVSKISHFHVQYCLMLINYPLLYTLVYFGLLKLVYKTKAIFGIAKNWTDFLIPFSLYFISLFGILYPNSIPILTTELKDISFLQLPKLSIIYLFVIWIFIVLLDKKYEYLGYIGGLLCVSSITVAPAILMSLSVFIFIRFLFKKNSLKQVIRYIAPILVTMIFYLIFYSLNSEKYGVGLTINDAVVLYTKHSTYATILNVIGKTHIQILITAIPFIVVLLLVKKNLRQLNSEIFNLVIISIPISVCTWAVFHFIFDSVQFWYNLYLPIVNVFAFILLLCSLFGRHNFKWVLPFCGLIFFLSIVQNNPFGKHRTLIATPPKYVQTKIIESKPVMAYIQEPNYYKDPFSKQEQVRLGGLHSLIRTFDPLYLVCISNHLISTDNPRELQMVNSSTFMKYCNSLKRNGEFTSFENAQLSFSSKYHIQYILVSNQRMLPPHFRNDYTFESIGVIDGFSVYARK